MLARTVLSAIVAFGVVACASTLVASPTPPANVATAQPTAVAPSPTLTTSPTASPSEPSASPAVTVRTLGKNWGETFPLLLEELMYRFGPGGRPGTWEPALDGVPRDADLKKYVAGARGVEVKIGPRLWLGTIEGWARSLDSTEIVVPENGGSQNAFIILRVPAKFEFSFPEGTLAAIRFRQVDAPAGVALPAGAELWVMTSSVAFTMPPKK